MKEGKKGLLLVFGESRHPRQHGLVRACHFCTSDDIRYADVEFVA